MKTRILAANGSVLFNGSEKALAIWKRTMFLPADAVVQEVPNGKSFSDLTAPEAKPEPVWAKDSQLEHFGLRANTVVITHHLKEAPPIKVRSEE